jgi:hypothetical protein
MVSATDGRAAAMEAAACGMGSASTTSMTTAMLSENKLRKTKENCEDTTGEKYLQNDGFHIVILTKPRWVASVGRTTARNPI